MVILQLLIAYCFALSGSCGNCKVCSASAPLTGTKRRLSQQETVQWHLAVIVIVK